MQVNPVNGTKRPTDWNVVNWRRAEKNVRNLRQRIFRVTQEGNLKKGRSLQQLMLRSRSNVLMSVRRVTQLNPGRRTAGVDRLLVKTPAARGKLVDQLRAHQPWRVKPARRVYIPKANGRLRPLGIPAITDRCLQAMVKNALEPYWEAKFEGISYGFRPGRGGHDAIAKIFLLARPNQRKKWVLDADIKGAFDNLDHRYLLETMGPCPGRELIKQWLKAGYLESGVFHETPTGTPQGGVISPLLANIALHGMEEALGIEYDNRGQIKGRRAVVRYADDFVVFCENREDAEAAKQELEIWLKQRGVTLSTEKTRIAHLTEGFDFLGFNIRHYKAPLTAKSGFKLLIKPSKKSVTAIRAKLRGEWLKLRSQPVRTVIARLNPIIRGEANYYRIAVASRTFAQLDNWMFRRETRYVNHTHPNKPQYWRQRNYWGKLNKHRKDTWVFGNKDDGTFLLKFSWFPIERHILVKGRASPDDPELKAYWAKRAKARATTLTPRKQQLAKNQDFVCRLCGMSLFNDEAIQEHHLRPRKLGGKDVPENVTLVHLYCQQQIHSGKIVPRDAAGELLLLCD